MAQPAAQAQPLASQLLLLVERGDADSLRSVLGASSSPSADANVTFTAERVSLLHVAAARGAAAVCSVLLGAGAQPRARDSGGVTPLHRASCEGHAAVCHLLLLGGANAGDVDSAGASALHDGAVRRGRRRGARAQPCRWGAMNCHFCAGRR
jgi:ankyrin repeat protein